MDRPASIALQPLRISNGWIIEWNTIYEEDPHSSANANGYYTGDPNLFLAHHPRRMHAIDIAWRTPDDEPRGGRYRLQVLRIVDDDPVPELRRCHPARKFEFDWLKPIRVFETASREELVVELEAWLRNESPHV